MSAPAPHRTTASSVLRYLGVGGLSYLVDVATLYALHGRLGQPLLPATAIALSTGFVVNFGLNRTVVFASDGHLHRQLARYLLLVGGNYVTTLLMVGVLAAAGTPYLVAKTVAVAVNAVLNYAAYRWWVFTPRGRPSSP